MKDVRDRRDDDDRENGTNGEDHKGKIRRHHSSTRFTDSYLLEDSMESPVPAHDELDTAE